MSKIEELAEQEAHLRAIQDADEAQFQLSRLSLQLERIRDYASSTVEIVKLANTTPPHAEYWRNELIRSMSTIKGLAESGLD